MAPSTVPRAGERSGDARLDARTHEWAAVGLISPEQGEAIRRYERTVIPEDQPEAEPARLGLAAEGAAYLGTVLAAMGGIVVVGRRWGDLGLYGRLGVALAVAVVGLWAGSWLVHLGEAATRRLGSVLWVAGVAGVALGVGVMLDELDADGGTSAIVLGVLIAVMGVELWRNEDRPLQLLTTVVGAGVATGGVVDVAEVPVWRAAFAVWLASIVWFAAAARGRLRPRFTGLASGFAGAMVGAAMFSDLDDRVGPAVAAVIAAAVVVFALVDRSQPLLALGVIGFLIATEALLATAFTGLVASSLVTLVGLAVVAVVVMRARTPRSPTG